MEAVGEVNLGAIEEHEELRECFRFLTEQKGDLESSIAQLRDAMARPLVAQRSVARIIESAVDRHRASKRTAAGGAHNFDGALRLSSVLAEHQERTVCEQVRNRTPGMEHNRTSACSRNHLIIPAALPPGIHPQVPEAELLETT